MYEDSWYSFVPDLGHKRGPSNSQAPGHRRKESLLQQPNVRVLCTHPPRGILCVELTQRVQGVTKHTESEELLDDVFEEIEDTNTPPEAEVIRRARSYTDFYSVVRAELRKDEAKRKKARRKDRSWQALMVPDSCSAANVVGEPILDTYEDELLEASQQEYL
jgi:conserved oligomeric Golgi complex subunit 3